MRRGGRGAGRESAGLPLCASLGLTLYWWTSASSAGGGRDRAVGLDLDVHWRQQRDHPGEGGGLEQRLAAGDDQAALAERRDPRGGIGFGQRDLIGLAVIGQAVAVRAVVAVEAPGIGGVAPDAGEVAARQADECAGPPGGGPSPWSEAKISGSPGVVAARVSGIGSCPQRAALRQAQAERGFVPGTYPTSRSA